MINIMNSSKECIKEMEHSLDPQLWHACAGGMVQMPSINSKVFYFPQGHIEHAQVNIDPKIHPKNLAPFIPCKISAIKYLASQETDEVYVKIRLVPLRGNNFDYDDIELNGVQQIDGSEKPASFAKTLTQSDANNGGGFSVPRYCAETIFPRLDYSVEPPVQTILAKDVHGVTWKFRHIYRGTPRRHLLTTGWSNFVNQKKLVAGDSIVFLRAENGDLCVGIRRARRGVGDSPESPLGWNGKCGSPYQGYAAFLRDDENKLFRSLNVNGISSCGSSRGNGEMRDENVVEAITLAASDQPFEVVYYPRASTPEFFVKASLVRAALQVQWCTGMRFKMAFETEDSSRISWFMGTVSSVQVADPINWPNSPWRLLQATWDEPDLLQNVKRVNPWLVELVASMPQIHMSPFSPPRKKLRLAQGPDFSFIDQLPIPSFSSSTFTPRSPLFGLADKVPTGVQGARHSQFGQFLSDFHTDKQNSSVLSNRLDLKFPNGRFLSKIKTTEDLSSFLTMGIPKKNDTTTAPKFMLFGKPILTEQQILQNSFGDSTGSSTSDGNLERINCTSDVSNGTLNSSPNERFPSFNSSCKTFIELKEVGQSLGLSSLGSYEDLYKKIAQHAWQGKMRETEQCAL